MPHTFSPPRSFLTRFFFSLICLRDLVTLSLRPACGCESKSGQGEVSLDVRRKGRRDAAWRGDWNTQEVSLPNFPLACVREKAKQVHRALRSPPPRAISAEASPPPSSYYPATRCIAAIINPKSTRPAQRLSRTSPSAVTHPDDTVLGLELLHGINVVVDQPEASGLPPTELRAEAEEADARVVTHIVHLGQLLAELRLLGNRGG